MESFAYSTLFYSGPLIYHKFLSWTLAFLGIIIPTIPFYFSQSPFFTLMIMFTFATFSHIYRTLESTCFLNFHKLTNNCSYSPNIAFYPSFFYRYIKVNKTIFLHELSSVLSHCYIPLFYSQESVHQLLNFPRHVLDHLMTLTSFTMTH